MHNSVQQLLFFSCRKRIQTTSSYIYNRLFLNGVKSDMCIVALGEGGREGGREEKREGGRDGGREGGSEGGKEGGREGGRDGPMKR